MCHTRTHISNAPFAGGLLNISDAYKHPLFNSAVDARTGYKTRNVLCCAVPDVDEQPIAVLQVCVNSCYMLCAACMFAARCGSQPWCGLSPAAAAPEPACASSLPSALRSAPSPTPTAAPTPAPAPCQALNKRGGADFSPVDEQHLKLFSVHLGNTLAKIRFYEEAR